MYYEHEFVDIWYEEIGEGPIILGVHGYRVNHLFIKNFVEPNINKNEFKRVYFDLPGMGKSKLKKHIPNADVMSDIIYSFVKDIIKKESFYICANSYGGYLSQTLVYKLKNQVKGVFFIAPVTIGVLKDRDIDAIKIEHEKIDYQGNNKEYYKDYLNTQAVVNELTWQAYQEDVIPGIIETDSKFAKEYRQGRGYGLTYEMDMKEDLNDIYGIVLFGRNDHIVGVQDGIKKLSNYRNSTVIVLNDAGHNIQLDQNEKTSELFKMYINKIKNNNK
ncbi:MAG: alpha/beta fold hydrolase [Erysipelotrichales bacterium]